MQYEIRKADMHNFKQYTIWKHATEDVWEVCPENRGMGSDELILVDEKNIMEFDFQGEHFMVFTNGGPDYFSKVEEFKGMGLQKVVYVRFTDEDFVNLTIQ